MLKVGLMILNNLNYKLLAARIDGAIKKIEPDLRGQQVLTEAASGPFISTAVIAALAGAEKVIACTRDSRWGTADEIAGLMNKLATYFGVRNQVEVSTRSAVDMAQGVDVVTNLGFVRPISRQLIERLPAHAAIALMWEPWEFREEDIDLVAATEFDIPIIATNEHHPNLATFKAVGMLALKLLFEQMCEVSALNILVIGSDPFGHACCETLTAVGAHVTLLEPQGNWPNEAISSAFECADAIVLVEHRSRIELLGSSTPRLVELISRRGVQLIHISGLVDVKYLSQNGVQKYPANDVAPGFMTQTTAYVGIKPVVDLHAAGLHVGSIVSRERKKGVAIDLAIEKAIISGYGLKLLGEVS